MEAARDTWLREAVDVRDGVSHFRAAKLFIFTPIQGADGAIDAARPVFEHHGTAIEPLPFMERLYRACVEFCQDFLSRALNLKVPHLELSPADQGRAAEVAGPHARFIKWEWTMNGGIVCGMFNTSSAE